MRKRKENERSVILKKLRKAHAANDAAVLKQYGWPTDLTEPEIVSRRFGMYARMTAK